MKSIVSLLLCCAIVSGSTQSPSTNKLEAYMDAHARLIDFSGTVLVAINDSIALKKAYGSADYEWNIPTTIDTKYSLASVSKQFTAVAILQLAEQGMLSLDNVLSDFYPAYPEGEKISIDMLLSHNSGVAEDVNELFNSNSSLDSDSVIGYIMTRPVMFEPGTQSSYSNVGYYILACIIEKTSGMSYARYMKEHVLDKAGMMNSGVSSNDSIVIKMSKTYHRIDGMLVKNPYGNWRYNIGMDGIYSTVEDLLLWKNSLFDGTALLSEESRSRMFATRDGESFGYGVMVDPHYSHGHSLIGHDGGYYGTQTSFNYFDVDDIFVTVLSNNGSPSYLLAYGLSALALGLPVEMPYQHKAVPIDPKLYGAYVGVYEGIHIHEDNGKLFYSDHDIELIPESDSKFFRSDNHERTLEFKKIEKGKATQLTLSTLGVLDLKNRTE